MKFQFFKPIDNSPLIIFRIFFGLLLALESFGALLTGWVTRVFVEPEYAFTHIGFEWLEPLPGNGMYYYYILMGFLGVSIMLGYKYRLTLAAFTILWTGVYLMQKTSYNNHYYLLILICIIMLVLPADRYASLDAKNNPEIKRLSMPQWCSWVLIIQVAIMYFFAAIAKFYPGWLDGTFTSQLFSKNPFPSLNPVLKHHSFHLFIAYSGIIFDLFIIPLFLYKKTRSAAFFAAVFFHIFNAIFLQIGIFPFFALSFIVFCYPPEFIRTIFFRQKPKLSLITKSYSSKPLLIWFFIPYFIIQLALPIRHWFIPNNVLWTEEGHRLSWRMMLRMRQGITHFHIVDKETQTTIPYDYTERLSYKQQSFVAAYPDGIWQMAQIIKKKFAAKNQEISIYVDSQVAINGGDFQTFINPKVDFATAEWNYFTPNTWIIVPEEYQ